MLAISVVMPSQRFERQRDIVEQALRICVERCRARLRAMDGKP